MQPCSCGYKREMPFPHGEQGTCRDSVHSSAVPEGVMPGSNGPDLCQGCWESGPWSGVRAEALSFPGVQRRPKISEKLSGWSRAP